MAKAGGYEVMWNQLVENGDMQVQGNWLFSSQSGKTNLEDGWLVYNETGNEHGAPALHNIRLTSSIPHHKYIYFLKIRRTNRNGNTAFYLFDILTVFNVKRFIGVTEIWAGFSNPSTASKIMTFYIADVPYQASHTVQAKDVAIIDVTQMFGAGNEPSTVAEFESWLQENGIDPTQYIPYDAGTPRMMTKPSWIQ